MDINTYSKVCFPRLWRLEICPCAVPVACTLVRLTRLARPLFHKLVVPVARRAACGRAAAHRAAARKVISVRMLMYTKANLECGLRLQVVVHISSSSYIEYEVERQQQQWVVSN